MGAEKRLKKAHVEKCYFKKVQELQGWKKNYVRLYCFFALLALFLVLSGLDLRHSKAERLDSTREGPRSCN